MIINISSYINEGWLEDARDSYQVLKGMEKDCAALKG
jgi:hypothetical protein